MISLVKIITESPYWDSDDYIPYDDLGVGTIVHCTRDSEDMCKVLEKLGNDELMVSLIDDPRDVRKVVYGRDVIAHVSDQNSDDADDPIDEIAESEENLDSESILPEDDKVLASGQGFDVLEIEEGLRESLESQKEKDNMFTYAWLDIHNRPAENAVSQLTFNETGTYISRGYWKSEGKCSTLREAAQKVENLLKSNANPKELAQHTIGWIISDARWRPGLYPMLDSEGVRIYKEAEDKLAADINRFYAGSNYTGD